MDVLYHALSRLGLVINRTPAATSASARENATKQPAHQQECEPTLTNVTESTPPATANPHTEPKKVVKRRKSQSQEDYESQRDEFWSSGPVVQDTDQHLFDKLDSLNPDSKVDRATLLHAAERAYYLKDYNKALEILDRTSKWATLGEKDTKEFDTVRAACESKLSSQGHKET